MNGIQIRKRGAVIGRSLFLYQQKRDKHEPYQKENTNYFDIGGCTGLCRAGAAQTVDIIGQSDIFIFIEKRRQGGV